MRTGVKDGFQLAILGAGDNHRLATHGHREVVTRLRNLTFVSQVHPVAFKNVLHFQVKQFTIRENAPVALVAAGVRVRDNGIANLVGELFEFVAHVIPLLLLLARAYAASVSRAR